MEAVVSINSELGVYNWGVRVANDIKATALHVGTAVVGVRVPAVPGSSNEKGRWVDPCTECALIVLQDLRGRPAM